MIVFSKQYWTRLSPLFRRTHNRLRAVRGLAPIPEPKISRYRPPRAVRHAIDPAEAAAAMAAFGREVDNPSDEVFLDWVKANAGDCTNEEMERAKAATAHSVRRPRRLFAEHRHVLARAIVAQKIAEGWKKSAAVDFAADELGLSKKWESRTVWTALKLAPRRRS
jgi:hypothetical protein